MHMWHSAICIIKLITKLISRKLINQLTWNLAFFLFLWCTTHSFIHCRNLTSPFRCFYVTHATRALQSYDLSGDVIIFGSHTYFFWPYKDMKGLPGWVISSIPGPVPTQRTLKVTAVGQAAACASVTQRVRDRSQVGTGFLGEVFSVFFLTCKTNVGKL